MESGVLQGIVQGNNFRFQIRRWNEKEDPSVSAVCVVKKGAIVCWPHLHYCQLDVHNY